MITCIYFRCYLIKMCLDKQVSVSVQICSSLLSQGPDHRLQHSSRPNLVLCATGRLPLTFRQHLNGSFCYLPLLPASPESHCEPLSPRSETMDVVSTSTSTCSISTSSIPDTNTHYNTLSCYMIDSSTEQAHASLLFSGIPLL